jgi:predicted O-methyltransferase YrrM
MSAPPDLPDVVQRAFDVCRSAGYVSFCRNETGRLLATLAATRGGTMAEFGTGCGVGTAWLRSGVRNGAHILTDELAADWNVLRDRGPFSLLFLDSGTPSEVGVDQVVDLVEPGGIVVLDDFAPCESWPPITYGRVDSLREQWLTDERFTAVEVMVAADASAVIATRR